MGLQAVAQAQQEVRSQVEDLRLVAATLDPEGGRPAERRKRFAKLQKEFSGSERPAQQHLGKVMESFAAGLFVGGKAGDWPWDNLDLERWFRLPKGHERRIHGHRHAKEPVDQSQAIQRRKVMRKARSPKNDRSSLPS